MKKTVKTESLKVILLFEHYQREYEFVNQLSKRIRKAGFDCLIYHIHFDFYKIILSAPYCCSIIYPFYYKSTDTNIHRLLKHLSGITHFNLAWEQTNYQANSKNKIPRDDFSRNNVTHFLWNKINFESYKEASAVHCCQLNIPNYNYITLGIPKAINPKHALKLLSKRSGYGIFFADNLSWIYYSQQKLHELYKTGTFTQNHINQLINYSREYLLKLLYDCKSSPEVELLFRLRPNVSIKRFYVVVNELGFSPSNIPDNFRLITSLTSNQFIKSSIPIVSNNSTILLDAYHAHSQCYMLNYLDMPSIFSYSWSNKIDTCSSLYDVLELSKISKKRNNSVNQDYSSPLLAISKMCNTITEKPRYKINLWRRIINRSIYYILALPYILKYMFLFARPKLKKQVSTHFSRDQIYHLYSRKYKEESLMSVPIDNL